MRKQNSEFVTAFTSEADQGLQNTDSFAFVALDDLACYVIADGIDDKVDAKSARLAVDSVITAFTEAPSMSRRALRHYMNIANTTLIRAVSRRRLKASITIIVHNYVKMRYAQAGNTRLRLYRNGFLKLQSKDQSLSMDLVEARRLERDKLAMHQEHNNLYCFLGQTREFSPFISRKIKLTSADAIALYTRGIWENVDEGELADAFADASTEPKETVDTIEDLLLSKQPMPLDKYTLVVLFVNKTFEDPNRRRRIKKILIIALIAVVLLTILTVVLVVRHNKRVSNTEKMNASINSAIQYIQTDNYIKAQADCQAAADLADQLKDASMQTETGNYLRLVESVIAGDEYLADEKYDDARIQYQNALKQSRYADNLGTDYVTEKLNRTNKYISVYDLIDMGDTLVDNLQYDKAEEKYNEAKNIANSIYFDTGRESANQALENLYSLMKTQQEEDNQAAQEAATQQAGATKVAAQGDAAFDEADYASAIVYYQTALEQYQEMDSPDQVSAMQRKIASAQAKLSAQSSQASSAATYVTRGDSAYAGGEYYQAKKYYLLAKDLYAKMRDDDNVENMTRKIEMVDTEIDASASAQAKENTLPTDAAGAAEEYAQREE